ncbi:MAG: pectin acetylesterase-family hydrolase [Pseudomonadales bacterium]
MARYLFCGLILVLGFGCASTKLSTVTVPTGLSNTFSALPSGWNTIKPGGETRCSDGSDYAFYVRAGDPNKLLVYLQGGGACWNLQTCDPLLEPTYSISAESSIPRRYDGIFNYTRSENPFKNHTVVFAPYCSADVHVGRAEQRYKRSPEQKAKIRAKGKHNGDIADEFTIVHRGFANANAVLDWTERHVEAPKNIFVSGSSAGSIPSPYYALRMARLYPQAKIVQLGDGAGGYRRSNPDSNPNLAWNTVAELSDDPAFAGVTNDNFNYEQIYIRAASAAPEVTFAAYDAAEDNVQKRYLALGGVQVASLLSAINANQRDIRQAVPGFRSYIAGGDSHTILARPEFYTFTVGDHSIRDWVAQLAAGQLVNNVVCDRCEIAETINRL